ncbi:MAG: acyltransferase family protein [Xanthomonadaceae bacterium]|nr:acyltransferase family protein [Xanthomonadaceae bacterium]
MTALSPQVGSGEALPGLREPAFDQLRALAMLAGVVFHAALAYSPLASPFWPTADRQHWVGVDALIWLPHLVRMPLFFLVSGYFTAALLARRGLAGLARQRVRRVLVPFVLAWPLVYLSLSASTEWALVHVQHPSGFLLMVQAWLAQPQPPALPPGTGHLWFLAYLLLFSLMVWIGRSLEWSGLLDRWLALDMRAVALSLPLLLLPGFALTSVPHRHRRACCRRSGRLRCTGRFSRWASGCTGGWAGSRRWNRGCGRRCWRACCCIWCF